MASNRSLPTNLELDGISICRLCAEMSSCRSLTPLYSKDEQEQIVTKQINQLIGNLISPSDGLPQVACSKCIEKVAQCYSYINHVIESQNKLRRTLHASDIRTLNSANSNDKENMDNGSTPRVLFQSVDNVCRTSSNSLFSSDNNAVEFFIVQPDNSDTSVIDVNSMLKDVEEVNAENSKNVSQSNEHDNSSNGLIFVKEDHSALLEEVDVTDSFLENYDTLELPPSDGWPRDEKASIMNNIEKDNSIRVLHQCNICDQTFETEEAYLEHPCSENSDIQIIADEERPSDNHHRFCRICNRIFKSSLVYQMHLSQHKNANLCNSCNICFNDPTSLRAHIHEVHTQTTYKSDNNVLVMTESTSGNREQCATCGKITNNLRQHEMYHTIKELETCKERSRQTLKKWFLCKICNKKVFSEANYLFHVAKHDGVEVVSCKQCDYVATTVQEYNMHSTTHTGGKYFICNDCGKCFFTRSAISDHVLIHMEGTRYMCEICGKRFKTSRSNAQHKLLQHKKYYRCTRCNRGFTHESKLNVHNNVCQAIHQDSSDSKVFEPVEKFFCNICNSNIKSTSEVSILFHKAKHEGKNGVECRVCHILCKNACMYKNHLLIHTNQRPFACKECSKSFRTKGCLVQHMLVHGNEFKYECEHCGKKSKKLTTHVNHVNIHTGKKPYSCPDCERPFRQLSDMKKHRRTHLKYRPEENVRTILNVGSYELAIKTELVDELTDLSSIQQIHLI